MEDIRKETTEICELFNDCKDNLVPILSEIQAKYEHIPEDSQAVVSEYLRVPLAEVKGIIRMYSRFTVIPKGKYDIQICMGATCIQNGSGKILQRAKERLNLDLGQTSKDRKFSLNTSRCTGNCGLAPVVRINGKVYGDVSIKKLDEILDKLMKEN